jgi:predicted permease
MMDRVAQDIRLALRGFRRSPAFALTAVLTLGLGIGMAVAMFTIIDAVLFRRLPVRDEQGIAIMWTYHDPAVEQSIEYQTLLRIRPESQTMRDMAAVVHFGAIPIPWIEGDRAIELHRTQVTANFFDVLGAHPALGRFFTSNDSRAGAEPVMVISFSFWQGHFGGDSSVIGRSLVDAFGQSGVRIVGVAPPGLNYPSSVDTWMPIDDDQTAMGVLAIARLAPGATLSDARSEFFSLAQRLDPAHPHVGAKAIPLTQAIVGDVRPALIALTVAVGLLLMIACVNVGNLLLLRAAGRAREFSIRRALGADSARIMSPLFVESALLATAGGLLGALAARALIRVLLAFAPTQLPNSDVLREIGVPLAVVAGVTLVAMLMFGIVPSIVAAAAGFASPLQLGARSGSETKERSRLRRVLAASQMALALIVLAGAGLVVRSLDRLESVHLGFAPEHLSVVSLSLPARKYEWAGPSMLALGDRLMTRWKALPSVVALTPIAVAPFYGANVIASPIVVEGRTRPLAGAEPWAPMEEGGPDYFRTLGVPLVRGRGFLDSDRENALPVAIVSQEIANRYWPNQDPIGKRLRFWQHDSTAWRTIIGVAGDMRWRSLRDATPTVYLPWQQGFWQGGFALRTSGSLASVLPSLRRAAREIDPQLDLWQTRTLDDELAGPLAQPRMDSYVLSAFGFVALLLAAIGLYGVMASSVRDRTHDIGVRMALGATAGIVRAAVLREALVMVGAGALAGLAGAFVLTRLLAGVLYEISPADPVALFGACGLLLLVAIGAAYLPARRATQVDPARALRVE